jgi:PhnB protein
MDNNVVPMLAYENGPAALDWLCKAFGFREKARMLEKSGRLSHGEVEVEGGGVIMLATPTPDYESPKRHREHCDAAQKWSSVPWVIDGVLVHVADVEKHFQRAKAAGARILGGIEDGFPGKRYRAEDCEGHRWMFLEKAH